MKKRNIVLSLLLLGVVVFGIFYNTTLKDQWHVWDSGIRWLQSHTGTKYTSTNEAVEGSYSVELNLADLESNHGKKIFEQGRNHSIVVESIEKISENNEYSITLYSKGTYSVFNGKLISFCAHKPKVDGKYQSVETASALVQYMGNDYNCISLSRANLLRNYGDVYIYQVVLPNIDEIENSNSAVLTISGLTETKWTRNWGYREAK